MEYVVTLVLLSTLLLAAFIAGALYPNRILHWLRLKYYQYEVTIPLYMMTPVERFVMNSIFFLTIAMIIIAAVLYLPEHVMTISHRAFYYWSGYTQHAPSQSASLAPAVSASSLVSKVVGAGHNHLRTTGQDFAHEFSNAALAP